MVTNSKKEEKWIFSLAVPPNVAPKRSIEIVATLNPVDGSGKDESLPNPSPKDQNSTTTASFPSKGPAPVGGGFGGGLVEMVSPQETRANETKSLLNRETYETEDENDDDDDDDDEEDDNPSGVTYRKSSAGSYGTCWKFCNAAHGMKLESSTLLRLSYRPAWQTIPEYTQGKRQRNLLRTIACCCQSPEEIIEEQQIWEVYTTQNIVKTERLEVTIRGMGVCQAVQVYMRPMDDVDVDHMSTPKPYQMPLKLHQDRMEKQQEQTWTRFTEPDDDLTRAPSEDDYIVLTFAIPLQTHSNHDPPLLWKVDIPPQRSAKDMALDTISVLDGSVDLKEPATHVFIEGYQSWSFAGSVWKGKPQPKPAMLNVFSGAFNSGGCLPDPPTAVMGCDPSSDGVCAPDFLSSSTNHSVLRSGTKKYPYKSDFFTCITTGRDEIVDENGGAALICGWLSQHRQFGVISIDETLGNLKMHATHDAILKTRVSTDWAYAQLVSPHHYDEEPMVHYLHAAAAYNQAKPLQNGPLLTGWCSWYHYYENISEHVLRENFERLATMKNKVPTNVAVVDDGYMTAWGDWDSLKPQKFTSLDVVARDIASSRMRPGLWMAPFAADKHSQIAKLHPEWIIRNDRGVPANSSNCGKFFYGLDATNPQVREYVFKSVRRAVQDWGFQVLKIDFLYAACLEGNGKYDLSMTRAEAMHLALQTIREAAGPRVFLIGCGCPIATGIGYVDGMRVSADTGPTWYPAFPLPFWDHGTLPSLRAMIRNSMTRAPFGHRWWLNDPDCLLLGESTRLKGEEIISAASIIAMTCGMLLLSDDLTKVSINRMKILTKIFPMTGVSGVVLDLHTTKNKGLPSLIRLWCTDRYKHLENFRLTDSFMKSLQEEDYNAEATFFGRQSAFDFEKVCAVQERFRSCIHVAQGMGTWTVVSVSNWDDKPQVMHVPRLAIYSSSETGWRNHGDVMSSSSRLEDHEDNVSGFHVFAFWSNRYRWISVKENETTDSLKPYPISQRLLSHETEIFHIRKVTPGKPQYVGSDLHFSCGHEVLSFDASEQHRVKISLKTELSRVGHVFLFVPTVDTNHIQVSVAGKPTRWSVVGNVPENEDGGSHCCGRIVRAMVVVHSDGSDSDGEIVVDY
ncbi:alpha-galactosidase [Nitzschia inconspicua]|uniref:Alpha-galactosidase n=1 Tax=Nitzschia inconspicua TaxID=303405 RepID=A0A9K3LSX0_9STRA|nr:alpha-galactosidase [Nitzschia inconspicua]